MAESSDGFLGVFKHCTLCNPVVYGGHGQSLLLTMFCIVCDQPCYKYRLAVGTEERLVIHTAVARTLNIERTKSCNMYRTFSSQVSRCLGFHYKGSTRCYLAKQPPFRKYHVIITIVCSCNIYHVTVNLYCVGYELMDIVSPQERSIGGHFVW